MNSDYGITADCPPALEAPGAGVRHWGRRATLFALLRVLRRADSGSLRLTLPDGRHYLFGQPRSGGFDAEVEVLSYKALTRLVRGGDIGFAESYMDGEWRTPELYTVLRWACANEKALGAVTAGGRLARAFNRLIHRSRDNSRRGSRRNIAFHYDLGNAFYQTWLDETMTYSSALFRRPDESLRDAQLNKYRRIGELAGIESGDSVLEIGCGWGGFMEYAGTELAARVRGVTLSREQLAFANERVRKAGLGPGTGAHLTDYRETVGQYDAVVSIEMLEAVGEAHWPHYFEVLRQRLKPGASAVIQVITLAEERYPTYRRRTDFIQRHVFPGGMLPTPSILRRQAGQAGLETDHEHTFGLCYADTLALWREKFLDAWPRIASQGFDARFRRFWEYYLCYCEAGFRAGTIDVGIYRFRRPA